MTGFLLVGGGLSSRNNGVAVVVTLASAYYLWTFCPVTQFATVGFASSISIIFTQQVFFSNSQVKC